MTASEEPEDSFIPEPKHPDYRLLKDLIQQVEVRRRDYTGDASEIERFLSSMVDPASLSYIAIEQSTWMLSLNSPEEVFNRIAEVSKASDLFMTGFVVGYLLRGSRE